MFMPSCANSTGGVSPGGYSDSNGQRAPRCSEVHHSASRTFTTNQPSVTGTRPEPKSSSRASGTGPAAHGLDRGPATREQLERVDALADQHLDAVHDPRSTLARGLAERGLGSVAAVGEVDDDRARLDEARRDRE